MKDNQLNEYLANPLRFHPHNPRSYWINGMKFTCNNYIEGAINKYVNESHPYMVPLVTYYVNDDGQKTELEKQCRVKYDGPNGNIPAVVAEEKKDGSKNKKKD